MTKPITLLAVLVLAAIIVAPAFSTPATGQFNVPCDHVSTAPDDPIKFPGQPGASHMHEFFGNLSTNANSTPATMEAAGTSCDRPDDRAGYWAPTVYKAGVRQAPTSFLVYYRGASKSNVQAIPQGLKVIAGNGEAVGPQPTSILTYTCRSSGVGGSYNHAPTEAECQGTTFRTGFTIAVKFPDCWDGANLDSADHKAHMSYSSGGNCDSAHPIELPQLQVKVGYANTWGPITLSSGPDYTYHADFWNAYWDSAELQRLVTSCINANVDCGGAG